MVSGSSEQRWEGVGGREAPLVLSTDRREGQDSDRTPSARSYVRTSPHDPGRWCPVHQSSAGRVSEGAKRPLSYLRIDVKVKTVTGHQVPGVTSEPPRMIRADGVRFIRAALGGCRRARSAPC